MKKYLAKEEHEVAYQDLLRLISKHADKMTKLELLAVAANMVGKLVALQDQRTVSVSMALEVISENIAQGNKQLLELLSKSVGRG